MELCQWVPPQFTTVRQPLAKMAREATRLVIELSSDRTQPSQRIELAASVVRESTAPPRRH